MCTLCLCLVLRTGPNIAADRLPIGNNSEEEQVAAAVQLDCSEQEDLSECRKSSCPLRNIIHLKCISKHNQTEVCTLSYVT